MNAKLTKLSERRATLAARAATQRAELSQALAPSRGPLTLVGQGFAAVHCIRDHAALLLVGVVVFVGPLRTLGMVKWLPRGWLVWRAAVTAMRILPGVVSIISQLTPGREPRKVLSNMQTLQ